MVKYGFFNSMEGDRVYSAEDLACMYDGLVSDGVIRGLGCTAGGDGVRQNAGAYRYRKSYRWKKVDMEHGAVSAYYSTSKRKQCTS